jgi:hypothetical protein
MHAIDDPTGVGHTPTPPVEQPRLDEYGLLWVGRRWVAIPDAQVPVVRLLLESPDQLVRTTTIKTTYMRTGSSGHPASIRTMINRVVGRFAAVGLTLHTVHSKGLIYESPRP